MLHITKKGKIYIYHKLKGQRWSILTFEADSNRGVRLYREGEEPTTVPPEKKSQRCKTGMENMIKKIFEIKLNSFRRAASK